MDAQCEEKLRESLNELLLREPQRLIEQIIEQAKLLEQLREEVGRLRAELERLSAAPPGGVAPFRRAPNHRVSEPKGPGRRVGHPGSWRSEPAQIDEVIEVPLAQCPRCGGVLGPTTPFEQIIEEVPAVRAHVTRLITHGAYCGRCAQRVQSSHPLQVSKALGAAGRQLGPRALATAGVLRHELGLTVRKSCQALERLFGLRISAGGLCQGLDRVAKALEGEWQKLAGRLPQAAALHADETGWYLHNQRAMLWVFCTPKETLYRVVEHRDRASFHANVPASYEGVLVSDCLSVYDGTTATQQKCYAHHLRAISAAQAAREKPSPWLEQIGSLLRRAMEVGANRADLRAENVWENHLRALKVAAQVSLENPRPCPWEEGVRQRLNKQADHLFCFLEHDGVDATNNLAERQLRPAVIRRKLSCGNKTKQGAHTFEVLASLAATCRQNAQSFFDLLLYSLQPQAP